MRAKGGERQGAVGLWPGAGISPRSTAGQFGSQTVDGWAVRL